VDIVVGHYRLQSLLWQVIWYVNNFLIGAIFLAHPERNLWQTVSHQFLGLALITGPTCLLIAKMHDLWLKEMWIHQVAAFSYACAGLIMVWVYKEPEHEHYVGTDYRCMGSSVLTFTSMGIAGGSLLLLLLYLILLHSNCPSLTGDRGCPLKMEFGRITVLISSRTLSIPTSTPSSSPGILATLKRIVEFVVPSRGSAQGRMYANVSQVDTDQPQELHRDQLEMERKRLG